MTPLKGGILIFIGIATFPMFGGEKFLLWLALLAGIFSLMRIEENND